jgi:hypothetical protein
VSLARVGRYAPKPPLAEPEPDYHVEIDLP